MSFFQNAKNIVISGGSFNDTHGNIHTYNSIQATNVDSLTNINPTLNAFSPQPISQREFLLPPVWNGYIDALTI